MLLNTGGRDKIQILRGLAIISVVFIHSLPAGELQIWIRPFLNFGVGVFLFLSGMLTDPKKFNPSKRILKVIVPYIIWTAIYSLLYNIKHPANALTVFGGYLVKANATAAMYYIFVYCELTLLVPLIAKLAQSKYKYLGLLVSPVEMIIFRLLPTVTDERIGISGDGSTLFLFLSWFTHFYLGYLLGNGLIKLKLPIKSLCVLWIAALALQMLEGYCYYNFLNITNCGTQAKLSALLTSVVFCLMAYTFIQSEKPARAKLLKVIGDHSFGIYFSHLAVMFLLKHLPYYGKYVVFPLNGIVALLICLAAALIFQKIPGNHKKYLAM